MRSTDLTTDQLDAIRKRLAPTFAYLHKLHARMAEQGFEDADRLRMLVDQAEDALGAVLLELAALNFDGPGIPPHRKPKRKGELH
jgi:hypothetical protein